MGRWQVLQLLALQLCKAADILSLEPADVPTSQALWDTKISTWGGSVIQQNDSFHLFAAEFVDNCTVGQWTTNSRIVHAVASSPSGPFKLADGAAAVAVPIWAHNPEVVRHTDGTYLLFSIGRPNATVPCKCPSPIPAGFCPRPKLYPLWADEIQLHFTRDLNGEWERLGTIILGSNPSPFVTPTGEVYVAFKGGLQIAHAKTWRGPYKVITPLAGLLPRPSPSFPTYEDQFLWFDAQAKRWNCLFHQFSKTGQRNPSLSRQAYTQ